MKNLKELTKEQLETLKSYYLQSEIEDLHENYSFEEYLEYCNTHYEDDKTILELLLEE